MRIISCESWIVLLTSPFIYEETKEYYCHHNGRPSIDPVILVKYLLVGYLYGIESERRNEQEIQVNMAYPWFLGLDLDERVPDHSTISQNRRRRFGGENLFRRLFEHILHLCMGNGLVDGKLILTDSTHVKANASFKANVKVLAEHETTDYIASKGMYVYYQCGTYKSLSKKACTMHSIKSTRLEAAVLYAIQQQAYLAVSYSEIVSRINTAPLKKSQSIRLNDLIAAKEKELAKIMRYKQALYQDWKDGEITHNDYRHMSEDYERQVEAAKTVIDNLKSEQAELEKGVDTENPFLTAFSKYENIDKLTREILIELADHIKVHEGGDISIRFKFADEYRRVAEYIEVNTPAAAI